MLPKLESFATSDQGLEQASQEINKVIEHNSEYFERVWVERDLDCSRVRVKATSRVHGLSS